MDIVLSVIFVLEAVIKIISLGLLQNGEDSYLLDPWNILDFSIVLLSVISLTSNADLDFIKVLRVSRILRPLRLIKRAPSLKVAVQSLSKAVPQIFRLYVVLSFVTFLIAILMTTLLTGKLFKCDMEHIEEEHLAYK